MGKCKVENFELDIQDKKFSCKIVNSYVTNLDLLKNLNKLIFQTDLLLLYYRFLYKK